MSLPENLRKQILAQFDELIAEGDAIREVMKWVPPQVELVERRFVRLAPTEREIPGYFNFDFERMTEWLTRCVSLLDHAIPKSSAHVTLVEQLSKSYPASNIPENVVPKLRAIRKDLESGLFDNLIQRLDAAIASDYMGQADELLAEGQRGNHDHVPAAVLAGATLEHRLRKLCLEQTPPIDPLLPNGKKKTLNPLIDDLKFAGLYNETRATQLRHWARIRNHAAHGEFDQFNRTDVEKMLPGIKSFLEEFN